MKPEFEDEAIAQETFIVRAWLAEQGADAGRHILLKFLDYEDGITYVLAERSGGGNSNGQGRILRHARRR